MAMNKKETAEFERLKDELRLAKALRWTDPVSPDIPIPTYEEGLKKGFLFNAYSRRVDIACTEANYHSFGKDDRTTSQNPRRLYSTRALALKAMRNEVEIEVAQTLAEIDARIEKESMTEVLDAQASG